MKIASHTFLTHLCQVRLSFSFQLCHIKPIQTIIAGNVIDDSKNKNNDSKITFTTTQQSSYINCRMPYAKRHVRKGTKG